MKGGIDMMLFVRIACITTMKNPDKLPMIVFADYKFPIERLAEFKQTLLRASEVNVFLDGNTADTALTMQDPDVLLMQKYRGNLITKGVLQFITVRGFECIRDSWTRHQRLLEDVDIQYIDGMLNTATLKKAFSMFNPQG